MSGINGSCLCGAVQYSVSLPSIWCAHCHCSMCRKAHGAGCVTWAGFDHAGFELRQGEDHLKWFSSSPAARRGFCDQCGSTMFFESERWAGEIHVAVGCLDEEIDREPQANVYYSAHVEWMPHDTALKSVEPG